jgi:hypothetical protein
MVTSHQFLHAFDFGGGQMRDVQMSDAGVAPIRFAGRPTHQLDAAEPFHRGKREDIFQTLIAQNRADKSKLHGWNLS